MDVAMLLAEDNPASKARWGPMGTAARCAPVPDSARNSPAGGSGLALAVLLNRGKELAHLQPRKAALDHGQEGQHLGRARCDMLV